MRIVRSLVMAEASSTPEPRLSRTVRWRGTREDLPPRSRLPSFVEVQAGNAVTLASSDRGPLEAAPCHEVSERAEHDHNRQLSELTANEVKNRCGRHHDDKPGGCQRSQDRRDSRERRQDDADRSRQLRNAD